MGKVLLCWGWVWLRVRDWMGFEDLDKDGDGQNR